MKADEENERKEFFFFLHIFFSGGERGRKCHFILLYHPHSQYEKAIDGIEEHENGIRKEMAHVMGLCG